MSFAYYIFLLLIIFLSFILLKKNLTYSPKKIKIYLTIVIILFIMHNISLINLCIMKSSKIIYWLKQFIFSDYILVPIIIIPIIYVYLRSEKLKFIGSYVIAGILIAVYMIIVKASKIIIEVSMNYGFIIRLERELELSIISLIFLGILMMISIIILDKPFVNKRGIYFVIAAIIVVMIEEVLIISGIRIFPYAVIGKLIFVVIMNFVIDGFKKIRQETSSIG